MPPYIFMSSAIALPHVFDNERQPMREPVGVILAGGRGTRMGGVAKADVKLGDTRLLDLCIDRLDPQVSHLAVNANDPVGTRLPVIADTVAGHLGPLAGVLSGLIWGENVGATHIVTVAVDTPFFPCDLVPRLLMAGDGGLAIATTPDGQQGTFGLWPVALQSALAEFLNDGGRKVRAFTQTHAAALAPFPETTPPAFFNINTPDDLTQATGWI